MKPNPYQLGASGTKHLIVNPSASPDISPRATESANIPRDIIILIIDSMDAYVGINELIQLGNLPSGENHGGTSSILT
jgi:hypothetical protein